MITMIVKIKVSAQFCDLSVQTRPGARSCDKEREILAMVRGAIKAAMIGEMRKHKNGMVAEGATPEIRTNLVNNFKRERRTRRQKE